MIVDNMLSFSWEDWMEGLYEELSRYKFIKNAVDYKKNNKIASSGMKQSITPNVVIKDVKDVKKFMKLLTKSKIIVHDSIKQREISSSDIRELNQLLDSTLRSKIKWNCTDQNTLVITGNFVTFSEITDQKGNLIHKCRSSPHPKNIYVFAFDTVFIDADLNLSEKGVQQLVAAAPNVHVKNRPNIDLGGANRKSYDPVLSFDYKNHTEAEPEINGENGGHFLIITEKVVDGMVNLNFESAGGSGGAGQDRPNYYSPVLDRFGICEGPASIQYCRVPLDFIGNEMIAAEIKRLDNFSCKCSIDDEDPQIYHIEIGGADFVPFPPTFGGYEGFRGEPGSLRIFSFSEYKPRVIPSDIRTIPSSPECPFGEKRTLEFQLQTIPICLQKESQSGVVIYPYRRLAYPDIDQISILSEYKRYAIENYSEGDFPKRENPTMEFIEDFDNYLLNLDGNSTFDPTEIFHLYNDLTSFEQFIDPRKHENFIPFHKSLLDRIENEVKLGIPENQKWIVGHLYTAILSKIYNLKYFSESNLIVDVDRYLDVVLDTIEEFKYIQTEELKYKALKNQLSKIEEKRKDYNKYLDGKVKEAEDLIKQMLDEIDKVEKELTKDADSLMIEIKKKKDQTESDKKKLEEQKQQLKERMIYKGILAYFRSAAQFLKFLGPIGTAASIAVDIGASVIDTACFSSEIKPKVPESLPPGIEKISETEKELNKHELKNAKSYLDIAINVTRSVELGFVKVGKELGKSDLFKETNNTALRNEIENLKTNKLPEIKDYQGARDLRDRSKTIIGEYHSKLNVAVSNAKGTLVAKTKPLLKSIDKLEEMAQLEHPAIAVYKTVVAYQDEISKVDGYIDQLNDQLKKLDQYQEYISEKLTPGLHDMVKQLKDTEEALKGKPKSVLIVARWQIVKQLKEMDLHVQEVTAGFKAKDKFARHIGDLKDVMMTMIELFSEIESTQERRRLINHVTDLSVLTVGDVPDEEQNAINKMESSIMANILLQQYHRAVEAVKQLVFPLADVFLGTDLLPSALQADQNLTTVDLADLTIEKVKLLKTKLGMYRSTVTKLDHCLGKGPFTSKFHVTQPFYVWRNEDHKKVIADLLSGKEVELKADIMNTLDDTFYAVKFTDIGLHFRLNDTKEEKELEEKLQNYALYMTHSGDSDYEYANKIYRISTEPQNLWYYLQREDKLPVHMGGAYVKISEGDFMLSPYTNWKIRLEYLYKAAIDLVEDKLYQYINRTDVELIGYGHYVTNVSEKCSKLEVERYYQTIDVSELMNSTDLVPINGSLGTIISIDELERKYNSTSSRKKREVTEDVILQNMSDNDDLYVHASIASSSATTLSSPMNSFCVWLKIQSVALALTATTIMASLPDTGFKNIFSHGSIAAKSSPSEYLESTILEEITEEGEDIYYDAVDSFESVMMKEYPSEIEDFIGYEEAPVSQKYLNYNQADSTNYDSLGLPSPFENVESSHLTASVNGSGLIMLADLLSRSFTGEKYGQRLFINPAQEKAREIHYLKQRVYEAFEDMDVIMDKGFNSLYMVS